MRPRDEIEEAGERIEQALTALARIEDRQVRETAEGALRLVVGLYGDALGRIVELLAVRWPEAAAALGHDDLVASLLVVHDLHPEPTARRVEGALEDVRPYLGSHGGDVELVSIDDGVVRLRLLGSCDGCASSSVTLKLAVERAIAEAAPEVVDIQVEEATRPTTSPLIAAETLMQRPPAFGGAAVAGGDGGGPSWQPVERSLLPTAGTARSLPVAGLDVAFARTPSGLYAYRDACPVCAGSFAGAPVDVAVITCPACGARYDVETAGRGVGVTGGHLDPLPLLERDGRVELAVPAGAHR
jgi:Fe-S cluster biogenesis protein NfuA/nitrite reductase/ring-hydroxylating ferredoxin subunit